ncbi:sulfur carrier protein ThiS [Campylobacter corcagiensis]|uniref:Sulfur carrier protein ThiS n=1 Tax=Campylobacter corcagiensis TaxID=1448857 RepID=A0A7M1LEQ8_9BACT|nr:sulfur carrier protein ThiS [Campylobacter corcagiensis]QKF64775.1 thiamine biosynthesis protein [Campylobacter corcagiensis]QOQ87062.1 sulfur carrier protein ThiS [Campylobacter corcagiensis]
MLKINAKCENEFIGKSLSEFLKAKNYNISHIAVELNKEIVPKDRYDTTILKSGDILEIVTFVRGG